jgi:hypothetical protein
MAHGSGVHADGALISAMPLGITLVCGWATWRIGHRLGDSISGHGPDAQRIADGERDWTVPSAALLYTAGYAAVAVLTDALAATPVTDPSQSRVVLFSILLCGLLGAPAIAVGSGRAAIWTATLPASLVATAAACRRVVRLRLLISLLAFASALLTDFDTALNVTSQLHTDAGANVQLVVVSLLVVPNAVVFSGSYLLGPGFTVGTHTIVSPAVVTIGALPMFPLLAALPDTGPTPPWTSALIGVPPLVAALGAMRAQRHHPTYRWEEGALHGCGGGMLAGALFGILALLSGGSVGPGRMTDVGPLVGAVLVHAVTAFGIGGLVGGLVATWWQRRRLEPLASPSCDPSDRSEPAVDLQIGSLDEDPDATQATLTPVPDEDGPA